MEAEKLIRITADDGGNDPQQDEILLNLARETCLTDVSFFVNVSPPSPLVSEFLAFPGLSIGLHIDLTDERPVSAPEAVPSLVTPEGTFLKPGTLLKRGLLGRIRAEELSGEIKHQLTAFLERFGRIDHVDTHRHVHRIPVVARSLARALQELGLSPRVRTLSRCLVDGEHGRSSARRMRYWMADLKRVPGMVLKSRVHRVFQSSGLPMDDGLLTPWPAIAPEAADAAARWAAAFAAAPTGRWEANFHPGWNAAEAALLKDARFREGWTNSLTAPRRTRR